MNLREQGLQHAVLVDAHVIRRPSGLNAVIQFIDKTLVIAELEARKLRHDPTEIIMRAIQPALWLLVFGEVFSRMHAVPTGGLPYLDFMAPGILAQSVLFIAIFYGIAVIWERDLGIVHRLLTSPTPCTALVLGKALSASLRGLSQIFPRVAARRGAELESAGACRRALRRYLGRSAVFHPVTHHCFGGQDARTLHGNRPGVDDAALLRQQRDLSGRNHAPLAASRCPCEPVDL